MTGSHHKPEWLLPRWSVRTLVVLVTLVCAYLACWHPTRELGVWRVVFELELRRAGREAKFTRYDNAVAAVPLVISVDFVDIRKGAASTRARRLYYFWLFGYVAKLPYERPTFALLCPAHIQAK